MRLIVGLGNPGRSCAANRHNIGFRCLSHFARRHSLALDQRKSRSRIGVGEVMGIKVVVVKPQTYMNRSGEAIALLVQRFQVQLVDLIVIHDDLDLPLGRVRIREQGGAGGHNGMKSIIACLGSQDFPRIRVGIGRPESEADVIQYVLSDFTAAEKRIMGKVVATVAEAIGCILTQGIAAAMNRFNQGQVGAQPTSDTGPDQGRPYC